MDHLRKNHNLGLFARMDGPFERMFLELAIYGDDLEPEQISDKLGVKPDKSYRKGDERPRGSQYYKTGGWILKSGEIRIDDERNGEEIVENWFMSIPGDRQVWESLTLKYDVIVRLIGYTDQWNADFTLTPRALAKLGELGLPLMIDPYLSLDEPDA